jgi:alpha-amylase/alpha-mannosidase (GH57 family)
MDAPSFCWFTGMNRFICIHGHFYQPPRENPWLEAVELQDSAMPYHDWNQRITAECYAPNTTARILDGDQRIQRIVNNYARINFNFGPTLLAWMKEMMPDIHEAIIDADRQSRGFFGGHGSALAQVYNHMILPLANERDKQTQVRWGIRDFEARFGRAPEGLWLAETAVDTETLEVLVEHGIKFTILSPFQAKEVRSMGGDVWFDVNGGRIDPRKPYLVSLPSGKSIAVFFYDAPVSQAVAFERLLESGEKLSARLLGAFHDSEEDQLVHIATDGESYGHHHRHGEMALAYALEHIENNHLARITNYAEFLATHPPAMEVRIHERSAWSCSHGVGRWNEDCGCSSGRAGWKQMWRGPLREALDWLRDTVTPLFETDACTLLVDPWGARNDYVSVLLDRSPENLARFLGRHQRRTLSEAERSRVLKLMELQRYAMLMYTSCGWFFDELSGIETVQVIQYAARVVQLAEDLFQKEIEPDFLDRLEKAKSNIAEHCDGRCIYKKFVKPAMIDWQKAVAHYAISSVFEKYSERTNLFVYDFADEDRQTFSSGKAKLTVGRTLVTSKITLETARLSFAVLYMGEHNLTGGVRYFRSEDAYGAMITELKTAFEEVDYPQTIRLIDRHFGHANYSLKSLFKDEQRRILNEILASTREDLESRYRRITERYIPLIHFLGDTSNWLLPALQTAWEFILRVDVHRQLDSEHVPVEALQGLLKEAQARAVAVLDADFSYAVKSKMEDLMLRIAADPARMDTITNLKELAELVVPLPLGLNLWKVQNTYWEMLQRTVPGYRHKALAGDSAARAWLDEFLKLGDRLQFAIQPHRV